MLSPPLRRTRVALALWLLLPAAALAQEPQQPLTLQQALSLARARAPSLLAATQRVEEARGEAQGASALLGTNPVLEAEAGRRRAGESGPSQPDWSIGLSQTLEVGGQRGARRAGARAAVTGAEAARADAERRLLGEVAAAFYEALHAREALGLAAQNLEAAEALARATQARAEAGEVSAIELNLSRGALARARADAALARGAERAALGRLKPLLGMELAASLDITGDLGALALAPLQPADGAATPPQLAALQADVAQADAALQAARAEAVPDLTLGARVGREGEERLVTGLLSVPLPLFQRGQGARTSAQAQAARARLTLDAARRARDVELASARARTDAAAEALRTLRDEALPLAQDNLTLSTRAYEAGEMNLTELLLVRRDALETRALYLTRLLEAALARAQLATQLGVTP